MLDENRLQELMAISEQINSVQAKLAEIYAEIHVYKLIGEILEKIGESK
jgi:hypothetical protein